MEPVQALAILSLGAFLTVLVTAVFYIFTVRPRLLEPVPPNTVGLLDQTLRDELTEQRNVVAELNAALAHHTQQLEATAVRTTSGEPDEVLRGMLHAQNDAVGSLARLLDGHSEQLAGLDNRLGSQEVTLSRLAEQVDTVLPGIAAQVGEQNSKLSLLTHEMPPTEALARLEARFDHLSAQPSIQDQAERLISISTRLDEWAAGSAQRDEKLAEHARILAELDREMAVQAPILQRLDTRVSEHTTMLVTAAAERREQIGILERVLGDLGRLVPLIGKVIAAPVHSDQERLTDIKGIGPVYASRLYEAGVKTFRELAVMTPDEVHTLIGEPNWRRR
jgi:chromosome segregation ATPase